MDAQKSVFGMAQTRLPVFLFFFDINRHLPEKYFDVAFGYPPGTSQDGPQKINF